MSERALVHHVGEPAIDFFMSCLIRNIGGLTNLSVAVAQLGEKIIKDMDDFQASHICQIRANCVQYKPGEYADIRFRFDCLNCHEMPAVCYRFRLLPAKDFSVVKLQP